MSKDRELWEPEDWYPPLCPPTRLKEKILRNKDFSYVDSRAKTAPDASKENFRNLISYLTKNLDSDLHALRAIFMWMGAQEIGTRQEDTYTHVDSPRYYLREAFSHSSFINKLFAKLCRRANIPCILVNGKAKHGDYETGDGHISSQDTWAVVYVDGSWRFVFPHWAFVATSGHQKGNWMLVEDSGQPLRKRLTEDAGIKISHVNEFWFLTDPDEMNCYCHPDDDDKQLLNRTWTEQKFYSLPHFWQSYFSSGWNLLSPTQCIIKANRGSCEIEFQPPAANSKLNYQLFFNEKHSGRRFPENIHTELYVTRRNKDGGQRLSLLIRLPVEGIYKLEVAGVHGSQTCSLVRFLIDCDFVPSDTRPFPSRPEIGFGYGETALEAGLSEASHREGLVPVKSGQEIHFSFKAQDDVAIFARLVHATLSSEKLRANVSVRREGTDVTVTVRLPTDDFNPEYSLEVDSTEIKKGTCESVEKYSNVINYLLTSDNEILEKTKVESKEVYTTVVKKEARFQDALKRCEESDALRKRTEKMPSVAKEDAADLYRPPDQTIDAVFATLVLLGEKQAELQTWRQIWTRKNNLDDRMSSFQDRSLTPEQVKVAEERLNRHRWTPDDDIFARKLYTWCTKKITLYEMKKL